MAGERAGDAGDAGGPWEWSRGGVAQSAVVQPPRQDGGDIPGCGEFPHTDRVPEPVERSVPLRSEEEVCSQGGPGGGVADSGQQAFGVRVQPGNLWFAEIVFGGELEPWPGCHRRA